jgi:NADH:ubiquinone reductase (H+-translocating)
MKMNNKEMTSLNIPASDKPRIVIAGGGFGGINLLKRLNRRRFQIVLIDRYNFHTFQPLLYQVATAGLEPDSVLGPLRKIIKIKDEVYFRMLKIESIDPDNKTIQTSSGILSFDYFVLATGSEINYFNNKDIAKHAFPMKQITHALDLRSHIFQQFEKLEILNHKNREKKHMTFVVVGAGPTGVEVCGALAELKHHVLPKDYPGLDLNNMQIYLVEGLDKVLPSMSPQSGEKAKKYLEKMGINIILNCMTKDYDGETVQLSNGDKIKSDTLIWAAGVKGNLIDGFNNESIYKGKIQVDELNRVFSNYDAKKMYKDIFAIGDVAFMRHKRYPNGIPGLAQAAIQQGKQLAGNLNRLAQGKKPKHFHYRNKGVLATIGRNKAVADFPGNIRLYGFVGWVIWMVAHLLFLVGFRNKAVVFANWAWNYFTYDHGTRLIIRPSTKENDTISREMLEEMNESVM